jgi:lysozyme
MQSEGYAKRQPDDSCVAYWDSIGCVWTCGYGTTGGNVAANTHWTREEALQQLTIKWNEARAGVLRASPCLADPANANRLEALTDFAYNEGVGRYQGSSLRSYVDRQSWAQAAAEFPKWNLGGGRILAGLVTRRARERDLFLAPVSQTADKPVAPLVQSSVTVEPNFGMLLRAFFHSLFG